MKPSTFRNSLLLVVSPLVLACAIRDVQEDPDCCDVSTVGGAGGTTTAGGSRASGGHSSIGGSQAAGGAHTGGGTTSSAGLTSVGGATSNGGTLATGGNFPSGGTLTANGNSGTGGAAVTGGTTSTGGTKATGGSNATGGAVNVGGTVATGGVTSSGGVVATGGMIATGGTKTTGGIIATGGSPATGGAPPTGGMANTGGTLSTCTSGTDCATTFCNVNTHQCVATQCDDAAKDGTETDVDCGGSCVSLSEKCPDTANCGRPLDCQSGVCTGGTCTAPSCTDSVQNGLETYTDCGGGCKGCAPGEPCKIRSDCDLTIANTDCINFICTVPLCNDSTKDGAETDVDCGGGTCQKCANGMKCAVAADCTSNRCADDGTGTLRCAVPTCSDSVQNQGESGIDCGGTSTCARCGTGQGCTAPSDCTNGVCGSNNTCSAPTCSDSVQNQQETDVDCGGPNCSTSTTACANGKICKVNTDCLESWCVISSGSTGVCTHPTCSDSVKNGTESDVDCGGTCPAKCADGKTCTKDLDCTNGWCNGSKCATPACTDMFQNGTETGVDCGGNCAASCSTLYDSNCRQCAVGVGCSVNLDCTSLNCAGNLCAAPTNCIAKELNGQGPSGCGLCVNINPSDVPKCKAYLLCYFLHDCNPITGKDGNGADCGSPSAVCGVNVIGGALAPQNAATASYTCACP